MDPTTYLFFEGAAFVVPPNPGPMVIFPGGVAVAQTVMKTTQAAFDRDKNYFLSYKNISRACFCMLDANVLAQLKVSNNAALTKWNSMMSIINILAQLQGSYGKPNMMRLYENDTFFCSQISPGNSPKMLFYQLEQCQEIQCIGKLPYTDDQIIANAVRILATSNIFPLKEFDTWEAMATKMYPALKTFFQEAYGCCLTAIKLRSMTGQNGYTNNNTYNAFETNNNNTNDDTITKSAMVPQTAAEATSSLGTSPCTNFAGNAEIAAAINQLSANQTAIMSQMAAMSFAPATTQATRGASNTFQVTPIQQLAIPLQQHFPQGKFNAGRGCCGGRGLGWGRGRCGHTPFADHMRAAGLVPALPGQIVPFGRVGVQIPPFQGGQQRPQNPNFSNIYKRLNNWNVCFSYGFNIEDGHTSLTCPFKKANHQTLYVRKNAQQFIAAGYNPYTRGMHKTVLPLGRIA